MTLPTPEAVAALRLRNRKAVKTGKIGQEEAEKYLSLLGITCEPVETGWTIRRAPLPPPAKGTRIVGAFPKEKPIADVFGVYRGRSVLCEAKVEESEKLSLSRLEQHQQDGLTAWREAGAICWVAWVRTTPVKQLRLIPWPWKPWCKGSPMDWELALISHPVALHQLTQGAFL